MYKLFFACLCFLALSSSLLAQPYTTGIPLEPDPDYDDIPVKAEQTKSLYRSLGSSASLAKWAPTPGSQGNYGTCAAWATAYTARSILEAKANGWTDTKTIDDNTFSYGFLYRLSSSSKNCWGAYLSRCADNMKVYGVPKYKDFKAHCYNGNKLPQQAYDAAKNFKIKDYVRLWDKNDGTTDKQKVAKAKKSLSEGYPIAVSMICPNSFMYAKSDLWRPTESAEESPSNPHGRHAVCLIGYDDDKYGGAFLVQNSWGTSWGGNGRIWVKYKDFPAFFYQAIEIVGEPAKAPAKRELAGSLRLEGYEGQAMQARIQADKSSFRLKSSYRSGTRFRMYIGNQAPAYVYAIGDDLRHKPFVVFPHKPNVSPLLNYQKNEVPLPNEEKHLRLNGQVGTDFLCIIYSQEPLDIDQVCRQLKQQNSKLSFKSRLKAVLGPKLADDSALKYSLGSNGQMKFRGKGRCAALLVEIPHID